ncbi:MAG: pilin [Candidatus Jorgensenbacteria bacterium]
MKYRAIKFIIVTAILINALGAVVVSAASISADIPSVGCLVGDATQCPATVEKGNISQAIIRFYQFAVAIAGILAVGMIVAGSVYYSVSAGSPDRQSEGKDMITSAIWGIVLLFGSYLILNTVNPRLTALEQPYTPAAVACQLDKDRNPVKQYDAQGNLLPCLPRAFSYQDILIPGDTQATALSAEELAKAQQSRPPEVAYCTALNPAPPPEQLKACIVRAKCTGCVGLNLSIPMKPGQCRWGGEPSDCKVNPKTNAALQQLNIAIPGSTGIVVQSGLRDLYMKWEVTEAFPPTVIHKSQEHYNGCAVDVALRIDNRKYLGQSDCGYLKQFSTAAESAGFQVTNEYTSCGGKRYETSIGGHLHLTTKSCP